MGKSIDVKVDMGHGLSFLSLIFYLSVDIVKRQFI